MYTNRVAGGSRTLATVLLFIGLVVTGFGAGAVHAQEAGIEVRPAIIEERVEPGESYSFSITIANKGSTRETFYFEKRDISGMGADGRPIFAEPGQEKTGFEASSWISIGKESLVLAPGESGVVPIAVTVPPGIANGGYFASTLITTSPPELSGVGTTVSYGASNVIALRVGGGAGNAIEEVSIREFRTDKALYGTAEVIFTTKVANVGNVLVRPRGPLEITDMFGKKVGSFVVNPEAGAVLPRGERVFESTWKGEGLLFGRYQVVVSLGYGEEDKQTASETLSFWIVPSGIIVPLIAVSILLLVGLYLLTQMHIRRKMRRMNLEPGTRSKSASYGKGKQVSGAKLFVGVVLLSALGFFLVLFFLLA